jgi:sarcosine oxidase gamma subunit
VPERTPTARSPLPQPPSEGTGEVILEDLSLAGKWRVWPGPYADVRPGTARRDGELLVWSVSPSEVTVVGPRPPGDDVVDLTHVRAMLRATGEASRDLLARLCALDLSDAMFPSGRAARTLVAGVATEVVRDDTAGSRSYLLLPSRSFALCLLESILDAGHDLGLAQGATPGA